MKGLLEKIKKKPKPVRDQYAFYGALGVTAIIATVWAISIPASLERLGQPEMVEQEESGSSAFSTLIEQGKEQFATVREAVKSFSSTTPSIGVDENIMATTSGSEVSQENEISRIIRSVQDQTITTPPQPEPVRYVQIGTTSSSTIITSED